MASEQGDRSRRPIEPLVTVVSESVSLGYSALELVVEGLRESLRLQSGRGAARTGRATVPLSVRPATGAGQEGAQSGPQSGAQTQGRATLTTSAALVGDFAAIAAELFGRAGAVASEVASTVSERVAQPAQTPSIPELVVDAVVGEPTTLEFSVWNTGPTALRKVVLNATDLIGSGHHSIRDAIKFRPAIVAQVGPGRSVDVEVDVSVPKSAVAGVYRGLIQAEPGDTCAVLMLNVAAAPKRRAAKTAK
jgi:hypothetical protein